MNNGQSIIYTMKNDLAVIYVYAGIAVFIWLGIHMKT